MTISVLLKFYLDNRYAMMPISTVCNGDHLLMYTPIQLVLWLHLAAVTVRCTQDVLN